MKKVKIKKHKRCPRCNLKTFFDAKSCNRCELNFDKFMTATNEEGKNALKKGEKERVIYTTKLPVDISKWKLFFLALFFGWTGAHLWKVGRFSRAITHSIGLILGLTYYVMYTFGVGDILLGIGNVFGVFWAITFSIAAVDIIEIAFNIFKVPVSLPYKEEK